MLQRDKKPCAYRVKDGEVTGCKWNPPSTTKAKVPTPSTKGVGGRPHPLLSRKPLPREREILWGIRDIFDSLKNVKVFTWSP